MRLRVISGIVWKVTLQIATGAITAYFGNNSQLLLIMLYTTLRGGSLLLLIGTFFMWLLQKLLVLLFSFWSNLDCLCFLLWLFKHVWIVTSIWILQVLLKAFNSISTAIYIGTIVVWILAPKFIYTTLILTFFYPFFFFLFFNFFNLPGWHSLDRPSRGPILLLSRRSWRITCIIRFFLKLIFSRFWCAISTLLHRIWFLVLHLHTTFKVFLRWGRSCLLECL